MSKRCLLRFCVAFLTLTTPEVLVGQLGDADFVHGEVLDASTGLPLEGAMVSLFLEDVSVASDALGYFKIFLPAGPGDRVQVEVAALGYSAVTATLSATSREAAVFRLAPDPVALAGIEARVRARRAEEMSGHPYDVISREDLAEMEGRAGQLLDVLRTKGPARLRIAMTTNGQGLRYCIEGTRGSTSLAGWAGQTTGTGCRPVLLVVDGQIAYNPQTEFSVDGKARFGLAEIRSSVSRRLLETPPEFVERVQFMTPMQAKFRFGAPGALGALIVETRRGGTPGKGPRSQR